MQIGSTSTSYAGMELQRLLGLQTKSGTASTGQNMPSGLSEASSSDPPPGPPPPRPADGASDQFSADTLSSLLSSQEKPSASDIVSSLIGSADADGDGSLSADELSSAISSAGGSVDTETLSSAIAKIDSSGDGVLSADELTSAIEDRMASRGPPPGPPPGGAPPGGAADASEVASSLIDSADTNGDGFLSADEIAASISDAGGAATSDDVATAASKLDTNGDGFISADELTAAIEQSFAQMASNAYQSTADSTTEETSTVAEAA